MNRQHSVVIGGGLSGLAAATYLGRAGLRTTLLERSPSLGGRAATDTPSGFALNRGAHALYTGGAASAVLSELGAIYTAGIPGRLFGRDANGLHPFPATALSMLRTDLIDAADKADLLRILMRVSGLRAATLANITVAAWIDSATRRPRVRQLLQAIARTYLYTAALDLASADVFVDRFQQSLKHPVHYVDGGWQSIADSLRSVALAAGVEILESASAAEIQLDGERATGVVLRNGRRIECDAIIAAMPSQDVLHVLPEHAAPRLRQTLADLVPVHIACLDLGLESLPNPRQPIVFDVNQPRFLTAQSEFARLAPAGGAVVHGLLQLDPRQQEHPAADRAALEALMDEVQPTWRGRIVEQRFLPRMMASGALPLARTGGMAGRPTPRCAELDNVYLAGDWVGPRGYLADAALASGRAAAHLLLAERVEHTLLAA